MVKTNNTKTDMIIDEKYMAEGFGEMIDEHSQVIKDADVYFKEEALTAPDTYRIVLVKP